jgi:hypothetical protein
MAPALVEEFASWNSLMMRAEISSETSIYIYIYAVLHGVLFQKLGNQNV